MTSSILKVVWIPVLATCVTVGGFSYLQGQSQTEFDLGFVPPSPAPNFPLPASTAAALGSSASNSNPSAGPLKPLTSGREMTAPPISRPTWNASRSQSQLNRAANNTEVRNSSMPSGGTATRRYSSSTPTPIYSKIPPIGRPSKPGGAVTVSHEVTEAGPPIAQAGTPFPNGRNSAVSTPTPLFPLDRNSPPSVLGSHLGLKPGETATERSLRLMSALGDLERHAEDVTQQNAHLSLLVHQRDEKLQLAVREVRAARKDLAAAKEDLERLKREVDGLREKFRNAEKDNAAVLQTMAPLLQQLLESDEVSSLPTKAAE